MFNFFCQFLHLTKYQTIIVLKLVLQLECRLTLIMNKKVNRFN